MPEIIEEADNHSSYALGGIIVKPSKNVYKKVLENLDEYVDPIKNKFLEELNKAKEEKKQKELKKQEENEYKQRLKTDEEFRKQEEEKEAEKQRKIFEKNRKQSEKVEEIAGKGYWNGKVYGSSKYGYSIYVDNKKYKIPESDYKVFDINTDK